MKVRIYTTKEVADLFGVSDATIRNEVARERIGYFKVGNENRFTQYHIDEYTQIKNLGRTEREIALEEEKEKLLEVIEGKDLLIRNIKDLLLEASLG